MKIRRIFIGILLLSFVLAAARAEAEVSVLREIESTFVKIAQRVKPTVVSIQSETRTQQGPRREPGGENPIPHPNIPVISSGSGVIIDKEGFILTNNHVVASSKRLRVRLADKSEYRARIVGADPYTDLALIKIDPKGKLSVALLGDSDKAQVGHWAIAVGDPFGISRTFTVGIISGIGRTGVGVARYENFIQTDAAMNRGNSGGPLVNIDGEIIGINTAIPSPSSGLGFAIPINMAREVVGHLRRQGTFPRGYLGVTIQPIENDMAHLLGLSKPQGALVGRLLPDGPAMQSGIVPGDVIVGLNGSRVLDTLHLQRLVGWTPPGEPVDLDVIRNGKRKKLSATLARLPDGKEPEVKAPAQEPEDDKEYGISLENLTPELMKKNHLASSKGILANEVKVGSRAFRDGLRAGMAIREIRYRAPGERTAPVQVAVRKIEEFEKLLDRLPAGTDILAKIARGSTRGERIFFMVLHSIRMK